MEQFAPLIRRRVDASYRAGDLYLSMAGTLVADTGKSIVIEERFIQNAREKTMRVEIPYEYVIRVVEAKNSCSGPSSGVAHRNC